MPTQHCEINTTLTAVGVVVMQCSTEK